MNYCTCLLIVLLLPVHSFAARVMSLFWWWMYCELYIKKSKWYLIVRKYNYFIAHIDWIHRNHHGFLGFPTKSFVVWAHTPVAMHVLHTLTCRAGGAYAQKGYGLDGDLPAFSHTKPEIPVVLIAGVFHLSILSVCEEFLSTSKWRIVRKVISQDSIGLSAVSKGLYSINFRNTHRAGHFSSF